MMHLRTTLAVLATLGVASAISCEEISPAHDDCVLACDVARRCGLLPSALGGYPSRSADANEGECVERCEASDTTAPQVSGLMALLADPDRARSITSLCRPSGLRECEELIEELDADPQTSELSITTELTVFMNSAVSHASSFSIESWCCFDYDYDIYESPEDYRGDGIDEVAKIYDMIEPTYACIARSLGAAEMAGEAFEGLMPEDPTPEAARAECDKLVGDLWRPRTPMDPDVDTHVCVYAAQSLRLQALDITERAMSCSREEVLELAMELQEIRRDWRLEPGDILVDASGAVRPVEGSPDAIETALEAEIRDELARPMGFLENACQEFFAEEGEDACETLVRGESLDADDCSGGPPCSEADCLAGAESCNRALCDVELAPPNQDCSFFGVTEVRLGYRNDEGTETLGEPITGCAAQDDVISVFPGVRSGTVTPIAVISGQLDVALNLGVSSDDAAYRWTFEGEPRWVSAGTAALELSSPLLLVLEHRLSNPLEYLGWVPARIPRGQACDIRPELCEGYFNDNCEDGIDNDGDGVLDEANAWCDPLFGELVERCVVTQPGRQPLPDCRYSPPDPFGDDDP